MLCHSVKRLVSIAAAIVAPLMAHAQGALEIPAPNSHQSGIGLISGWHCSARRIEIIIDDGPFILLSSHTPRDDTLATCGRSDTGFAMAFNWGILPHGCFNCANHKVRVFADGVLFATSQFSVTHLGAEYLAGKSGTYTLRGFPEFGSDTTVWWDEQKQNFSIIDISPLINAASFGNFVGALQTGPTAAGCIPPPVRDHYPLRYGKFSISMKDGTVSLKADYLDGGTCELPAAPMTLSNGFVFATFTAAQTAACPEFPGGLQLSASKERITARTNDSCQTVKLRASSLIY